MALLVAAVASSFLAALRTVQKFSLRFPVPLWARPAVGGAALSAVALPLILIVGSRIGKPGHALGILGGGYGAAQVAITGAAWLPTGWHGVELLLFQCFVKLIAGDFGPSLVLGGLLGGAFGRAAAILLHDPTIDPGAFALVGMGTFYGGLAHVPVSSLIMVFEMAGSYDLLLPSMLAERIIFVALRKRFLYDAQVPSHDDSPVHHRTGPLEILRSVRADSLMTRPPTYATFPSNAAALDMAHAMAEATWQMAFPVLDGAGRLVGVAGKSSIGMLSPDPGLQALAVAADLVQPHAVLRPEGSVRRAVDLFLESGLRQLPVVGSDGQIVGFLDESKVTRAYLESFATTLDRTTTAAMATVPGRAAPRVPPTRTL